MGVGGREEVHLPEKYNDMILFYFSKFSLINMIMQWNIIPFSAGSRHRDFSYLFYHFVLSLSWSKAILVG